MRGALDRLGFIRDDWNFPLVVERLDDSLSADEVAPKMVRRSQRLSDSEVRRLQGIISSSYKEAK